MVLLITYDLHKPERDYADVIAKIKSLGSWAHSEQSVWLVDTTKQPQACRDALVSVTSEATYFVARLWGSWASQDLSSDVVVWLKSGHRTW